MTQFATMLAALDFRNVVTGGNDNEIMNYMHTLAVRGGRLLAQEWNTELLLPTDSFAIAPRGFCADLRTHGRDVVQGLGLLRGW